MTGNTHRAEFCIDKLYSPDSATGRLGLVEFRSVRDAAARADEPDAATSGARLDRPLLGSRRTAQPLVRWGTALHDRFMLPHFIAQDFAEVLGELTRLRAIRSSRTGSRRTSNSASRMLGEASLRRRARSSCGRRSSRGTCWAKSRPAAAPSRYVDSSVERLQVKVRGMTDPRYVVACNGRRVCRCIRPARRANSWPACAIRAWQPPTCLHPTIGVHAPLVFDVSTPGRTARSAAARGTFASGRPELRDVSGQRLRGRKPPRRAVSPWATRPASCRCPRPSTTRTIL